MKITMGFNRKFSLGSIDISRVQRGISRACRIEVESYSKICNVQFTGATRPMIYVDCRSMPNYWALTYPGRKPGTGTIVYSNHPRVVAAHNEATLLNLPFHELWHALASRPANKQETVNYPPSQWAIDLLVKQYGKPPVSRALYAEASSPIYLDTPREEVVHASFFGRWLRWLDRFGTPVVYVVEDTRQERGLTQE